MFGRSKEKAQAAALAAAESLIETQREAIRNRAALIAMEVDGRTLKQTFVRNGQLIQIETYITLDANLPEWRRQLLEPLP